MSSRSKAPYCDLVPRKVFCFDSNNKGVDFMYCTQKKYKFDYQLQ